MSIVYGGAKSDDFQLSEGEIYVPDGCYAMWRPDLEGAGAILHDQVQSAHAAISGAVWVSGPNGPVLKFDGADDYALVSGDQVGIGARTIEVLVYVNSIGALSRLMDTGGGLQIATNLSGSDTKLHTSRNTSIYAATANVLVAQTWYHWVIASTATGVTNIYVNGVLSGTANQNAGTPVAGTGTWFFMRADTARWFAGHLALVRLYNKALTAGEVREAYYEVGPMVGLG